LSAGLCGVSFEYLSENPRDGLERSRRAWTFAAAAIITPLGAGALLGAWLLVSERTLATRDGVALATLAGLLGGVLSTRGSLGRPSRPVAMIFPRLSFALLLLAVLIGACGGVLVYLFWRSGLLLHPSTAHTNPRAVFVLAFVVGFVFPSATPIVLVSAR
jgi:hypothetical protein